MASEQRTGGEPPSQNILSKTPWDYLQTHSTSDWIWGTSNQLLQDIVQSYYKRLSELPSGTNIILAERDPVKFLAFWVAAASMPHRLILANPDWQPHEWQQIYQSITPDIFVGTAPAQNQDSIAQSTITRIPSPAILIPTGGSSGHIKFAIHTWQTLKAAVGGLQDFFGWQTINCCCVLPLHHVSGLMQAVRALISGGTIAIHPWQSLKIGCLPEIDSADYCLSLVPTQLSQLLQTAEQQPEIIDWLRPMLAIFLGGAPAWHRLLDRALALHLPLAPTYGMTETAAQIATIKPADFLRGQSGCGKILPHAHVVIAAEAGIPGPIEIQAASLFHGYWPPLSPGGNNHLQLCDLSNATQAGKTADSLNLTQPSMIFYPDDLGYFDQHGFLQLVGRSSDKIISGGENIFPVEVEAAIRATDLVQDVAVVGLPDAYWGEVVAAVVASDCPPSHHNALVQQLQTALGDRLSRYKHPKQWLISKTLPRQPNGKLAKPKVKSWLLDAASEG